VPLTLRSLDPPRQLDMVAPSSDAALVNAGLHDPLDGNRTCVLTRWPQPLLQDHTIEGLSADGTIPSEGLVRVDVPVRILPGGQIMSAAALLSKSTRRQESMSNGGNICSAPLLQIRAHPQRWRTHDAGRSAVMSTSLNPHGRRSS